MWRCGSCAESVEDTLFRAAAEAQPTGPGAAVGSVNALSSVRCHEALQHLGRKRFHEDPNWGIFGELGELFVKREHFDVYVCPRCGRVEFFIGGAAAQ
jgi:hypothetical protein